MEKGGAEPLSGHEVRACEWIEGRGSDSAAVVPRRRDPTGPRAARNDWRERTGLAHSAQGDRSWRLGARLRLDPSFDLSLEGTRAENADGHAAPKHSFTLGGP